MPNSWPIHYPLCLSIGVHESSKKVRHPHCWTDNDGDSAFYGARFADLADIRLVDLVGEDSLLALLMKGKIEPAPMYQALDAYMSDFQPGLVILDVLADLFPGDECDRSHVRQFINLLKRLCRKHACAILLLAHPSLTGINTGTGLSGSTDWNNSVRSRMYLYTPKNDEGTEINDHLRTLQGLKSNYRERGGKIDLNGKMASLSGSMGL